MSWASASVNTVGALGLDFGASIRAAPSNNEYSVWVWRWTNRSVIALRPAPSSRPLGGPVGTFPQDTRSLWTTYTHVIRRRSTLRRDRGGVKVAGGSGRGRARPRGPAAAGTPRARGRPSS